MRRFILDVTLIYCKNFGFFTTHILYILVDGDVGSCGDGADDDNGKDKG